MKVLLTGATGFVGSEILRQLDGAGHTVRIVVRDSRDGEPLKARYPRLEVFHGNILFVPSLKDCMEGIEAVIHLVGIIVEAGENTFERVHVHGTQNLVAEAKRGKVKRFVHMSALGSRADGRSQYHRTKWVAEEAVRGSGLDWTIFRPSIIYGSKDQFVNLFASMTRSWKRLFQLSSLPMIGGGDSKLQPIPVQDVARCFVGALAKPESTKKTYDLCGPRPLSLKEILRTIAETLHYDVSEVQLPFEKHLGRVSWLLLPFAVVFTAFFFQPRILLVPVPVKIGMLMGWLMEFWMSKPLLTREQVKMLEEDNIGDPSEAMRDFETQPPEFRDGIAAYL